MRVQLVHRMAEIGLLWLSKTDETSSDTASRTSQILAGDRHPVVGNLGTRQGMFSILID